MSLGSHPKGDNSQLPKFIRAGDQSGFRFSWLKWKSRIEFQSDPISSTLLNLSRGTKLKGEQEDCLHPGWDPGATKVEEKVSAKWEHNDRSLDPAKVPGATVLHQIPILETPWLAGSHRPFHEHCPFLRKDAYHPILKAPEIHPIRYQGKPETGSIFSPAKPTGPKVEQKHKQHNFLGRNGWDGREPLRELHEP